MPFAGKFTISSHYMCYFLFLYFGCSLNAEFLSSVSCCLLEDLHMIPG